MLQSNPEFAALYNAQTQQDLDIAQRAQEQGRLNQQFGADLYRQGAGLNTSGASLLSSMQGYQNAAYNPLRTSLGLFSDVERLGMQPFELSTGLGRTVADAGARQGEFVFSGERSAAPSSLAYSSYSPFAQTLQSAGQQLSGMGGSSGSTSNWFDNLITANRYGTNVGSQQTRMLAEQDRGLF
jgi:hypothetical protein